MIDDNENIINIVNLDEENSTQQVKNFINDFDGIFFSIFIAIVKYLNLSGEVLLAAT